MSNSTFVYHFYNYHPSQGASTVAAVLFGLVTIFHILQMVHYRKWVILPLVIGGFIMTIGYIARCISMTNTTALPPYITQSIALLVPPIFFAATIYSLLSRIAIFLDAEEALVIRPSRLTKTFVSLDILSFMIQGGGAGYLSRGNLDAFNTGSLIIVGGLAVQFIAFSAFIVIAIIFHRRIQRIQHPGASRLMWALYITSAFILVRSVYRLIEFAQGNSGYLMAHEVLFYIFDSILMLLTMITYNLVHPGASLRHKEVDELAMKESQRQREAM